MLSYSVAWIQATESANILVSALCGSMPDTVHIVFCVSDAPWSCVLCSPDLRRWKNLCFWTVVLVKTVPWTAKRSNLSILKEINAEYSLEGLMVKLKIQYFGHLMQRADLLEKTLMLGKIEGGRRRGWQRMKWLDGITDSMGMSLSKLQEIAGDRGAWRTARAHSYKVNRIVLLFFWTYFREWHPELLGWSFNSVHYTQPFVSHLIFNKYLSCPKWYGKCYNCRKQK